MSDLDADLSQTGPGRARAQEQAGHYNDIGRHDLAERVLGEALQREPNDALLHCELARTFKLMGREGDAEREAREALRLDPDAALSAHIVLAEIFMDRGQHRAAETEILTVLRTYPDNAPGYVFYASLMLKTGHPDKAERLAREALRIDADLQSAHGMLGLVLAERREKQAAHGHAEHSLALDPGHEGAHAAMGVTLLRTGHPLRARAHLREALRLDPDPETEELFLQADKCARWIYLPMYWWTLLIDRLPGKQFTVWGVVVGGLVVAPALGVPDRLIVVVAIAYIAFVVYTWVADGLVAAWVRMRPPR